MTSTFKNNYNKEFLTFSEIIQKLKNFWSSQNCTVLEAYDLEIGAATLNPYTAFRVLDKKDYNICQVQYCRRPLDGRFGENPNRMSGYYQMQILLKPAPENIQELCLKSYQEVGIDINKNDIRFIEDDWENPSIGASGIGYEVWCNGMEISQFTYMQKIGGMDCKIIAGEITLGLERLAMYVQNKTKYTDIIWSFDANNKPILYGDINKSIHEIQMCEYYQNYQEDTDFLMRAFEHYEKTCNNLLKDKLYYPAYEFCLKASHTLNVLDARKAISYLERKEMILRVRQLAMMCYSAIN